MMNSVARRNTLNLKRIDAFQAPNVIPVLPRIGTALMVSVDATDRTEVVLRSHGIELVQAQDTLALDNLEACERNRRDYRSLPPADRTVAPAGGHDSIRENEVQHHRPAMARSPMLRGYDGFPQ